VTGPAAARPDLGTTRVGRGLDEDGRRHSPYGRPILKEPTWTWEIPTYFYTGGLAGASAGLALLSGARGNEHLSRQAWGTAMAGAAISPVLLISDLGKPMRFLNMLRMFKPTSPMSVGSWILSAFSTTTGVAALDALTRHKVPVLRRAGRVAGPAAALLGLPLASYTGALIADTAIPVWHESRWLLPSVFVAGAAASAGGAAVALSHPACAAPARRLALIGTLSEMALKEVMQKRLGDLEAAYKEPVPHRFTQATRAALIPGVGLLCMRARRDRRAAIAAGTLINVGALCARWSIFKAGFASAARPDDTVVPQRGRIAADETHGATRRASAGARPVDRALASPATASASQPG
jgi:formate-dependent nitrite reductase membrane component NrfD